MVVNMLSRDLTGQRFGRLVAIHREPKLRKEWRWLFRCDCGNEKILEVGNVFRGHTRSCGCFASEVRSKTHFRHGKISRPEYKVWVTMRNRCMSRSSARPAPFRTGIAPPPRPGALPAPRAPSVLRSFGLAACSTFRRLEQRPHRRHQEACAKQCCQ